jgi:hypothetical protein
MAWTKLWPAIWPHGRAALILLHLVGIFVLSLPTPQRLGSRSHWNQAKQQGELKSWADRLGLDKEEFESFLWDTAQIYLQARKRVISPFAKYADYAGTRQGWTMFANPRRSSARLEISVEVGGAWQLVFRPHSSEHDWNRWQFDHNRIRKLLGRLATQPHQIAYTELTRWLARKLAKDFPGATRAKIVLIHWKLQEPEAVRRGARAKESVAKYQEFDLEALR